MPILKNVSPLGAISLPLIGCDLDAGEEFKVSSEIAGRAPSTTVDDEGVETYDPGEGLLAQAANYQLVTQSTGPTVAELKNQLGDRGLATTGKKADLIARLAAGDAQRIEDATDTDDEED